MRNIKKWIVFSGLLLILIIPILVLFFLRTGSDQTVSDVKTLEEQVLADWIKKHNLSENRSFSTFQYYGTDNGYHIVMFCIGAVTTGDSYNLDIAGYMFESLGHGDQLMAYKNGSFIKLKHAYYFRLVSKDAIAKAAELHQAEIEKDRERRQIQEAFRNLYGKFRSFRFYGEENGCYIIFAQVKSRPQVLTVKQIAGSEFRYPEEFSLYAYIADEFIDLEEAYNQGLVSKEAVAEAARVHKKDPNAPK